MAAIGTRLAALLVTLVAFGACTSTADEDTAGAGTGSSQGARCYERGWEECDIEPYPYRTPLPPAEPTRLDGTYTRTITPDLAGLTGNCRRCPPYRMLEGEEILTFDAGRFFVFHPDDGFTSSGHATVSGDRVTLFNDANCIGDDGVYEWTLEGDLLRLEAIRDTCPYTGLRRRYMVALPWARSEGQADPRCHPPNPEAAITGHWPVPQHCLDPDA
ncbi:hypothetical protein BH24ACT26_BH24ACT26_21350 [soil metagenome]